MRQGQAIQPYVCISKVHHSRKILFVNSSREFAWYYYKSNNMS